MYFGPLIVIASPIYALYLFVNKGEASLNELRRIFSFIAGALCSWLLIYFLYIKHS